MKTNINIFFLEEDADLDFPPFNREKHTTTPFSFCLVSIHFPTITTRIQNRSSIPSHHLMARPLTHLILILILHITQTIAVDTAFLRNRHHAMILPLYLTTPNSSTSPLDPRRQLHGSESKRHPNARMRLHDDLLLNG